MNMNYLREVKCYLFTCSIIWKYPLKYIYRPINYLSNQNGKLNLTMLRSHFMFTRILSQRCVLCFSFFFFSMSIYYILIIIDEACIAYTNFGIEWMKIEVYSYFQIIVIIIIIMLTNFGKRRQREAFLNNAI